MTDLARLLSGRAEPEEIQRTLVAHLLAHCPDCRRLDAELEALKREVGHWDEMVAVLEWREAPALWRRLEEQSYEEQLRTVEDDEGFHTWGLCRLLQRRSVETAASRPASASRLANLALVASGHLGEAYHPGWVLDLQALCFAALGNARRLLGELGSADDAFRESQARLRRSGGCSPRLAAEAAVHEAALRCAQGRCPEALALLDLAHAAYAGGDLEGADRHRLSEVLAAKAVCARHLHDLDAAVALLEQAARLADQEHDPRLVLHIRGEWVRNLLAAGRVVQADALVPDLVSLTARLGGDLDHLRLRWTFGRLAAAREQWQEAALMLREAQADLLRAGLPDEAARTALDLAGVYGRAADPAALERLAEELTPILLAPEARRSTIAAVLELQRACRQAALTPQLILDLGARLENGRVN